MKRGELWTVAGFGDYAGKPRPALVLQDEQFKNDSLTVCALTTLDIPAPLMRVVVEPTRQNGLLERSFVMIDKIITVPRSKFGKRVGPLESNTQMEVDRACLVFLGLSAATE